MSEKEVHYSDETWECRACGDHVPCRVSVRRGLTGDPELDQLNSFRNRGCLCFEGRTPNWEQTNE